MCTSTRTLPLSTAIVTLCQRLSGRGGVQKSASPGRRTTHDQKEQKCLQMKQNNLLIDGFKILTFTSSIS